VDEKKYPTHEVLRELVRIAHQARVRHDAESQTATLRLVYTICHEIVRKIQGQFPDLRIMIGDRVGERGPIQHHWLEFPANGIFLDPAYDELDPFQPVRIGRISDDDYPSTYQNRFDSSFTIDDPRDRPEAIYRPKSPVDQERGPE